tara:strand:+ start:509 stop:778 length:270 start_codon:yes stop_codon:yes gene_type:complete
MTTEEEIRIQKKTLKKRKRSFDELFPNKPVEMPAETKGKCKRCKQIQELGDGFCILCWDKGSDKNKDYTPKPKKRKYKRKVGRPRTVHV